MGSRGQWIEALARSTMSIVRLVDIDDLANPDSLAQVVGPVQAIEREPMPSAGFSGSTHQRLAVRLRSGERRRLVLKRTPLERDWISYAARRFATAFGWASNGLTHRLRGSRYVE